MLLPPVTIDDIKKFIIFNVEICRRLLLDKRNSSSKKDSMILQYVMLLDLKGAGVSTLDMELIPFAVDLARHHFPGYIGSIFVLNYGWMYSGIWQIFKRILPEESLSRIFFPSSNKELLDYFDDDDLLLEHGGNDDYQYNLKNYDIYQLYGKPSSVLSMPKSLYRVTSFDSSHEVFFTPYSTPYSSRPTTPIGDNNNNMSPSVINIRPPFKHRSSSSSRSPSRPSSRPSSRPPSPGMTPKSPRVIPLQPLTPTNTNNNGIVSPKPIKPILTNHLSNEDDEEERDGGQNNSSSSILNHEISTSLVSSPTNTKNLSSYSDSPISTTATTATTGLSIPKSRLYKLTRIHKTLKIYFERLLYRFISRRVTGVLYYMVMFVVFRGGLFNEFWKVITQNAFST
nr:9200_t:CDS:2 [Entrophospora candida]